MVVVIIGIVAAIAVPRLSAGARGARVSSLKSDLRTVQYAIDLYTVEHAGRHPAQKADGSTDADASNFVKRLVLETDIDGAAGTTYGPYLRAIPANPFTGLKTIRINGAVKGGGLAGWHFDTATATFSADDTVAHAAIKAGDITAVAVD